MQIVPSEFSLPFLRKEQVAKDTVAFYFDRTKSEFEFTAGQYIRMTLPHENPDERGIRRFFSIITSPLNKQELANTTKIHPEHPSSFKKNLLNLIPGTTVQFSGPYGRFVLDEEENVPHVFLAGGIGVTPFHSMLLNADEKKLTIPITLFASFSTAEETVFYEEFSQIAGRNPSIKIVYTVTHPEESQKPWNGETGRISSDMIKKYVTSTPETLFYIAGPPAMVTAMEEIVKGMEILPEKIRKENFVGY